jgi:hypothetical protein
MFVAVAVGVAVAESCIAVVDAACAAVEAAVRRTLPCFMTSCWKSARATSRESRALITCCVKDTVLRDSLSVRATLNPKFETLEDVGATQHTTARFSRHLRLGVANAGRRKGSLFAGVYGKQACPCDRVFTCAPRVNVSVLASSHGNSGGEHSRVSKSKDTNDADGAPARQGLLM